MANKFHALLRVSAYAVAIIAAMAPSVSAKTFKLVYTGTFNSSDSIAPKGGTPFKFTSPTPFIVSAVFDDSSPNIAAPVGVPGFVAYSPISASLIVNGMTFKIATYNDLPIHGITVAIFDNTTPFMPEHFAIGLLQNPLADGAGFIGDWSSASPTFSAAHIVPTVFTGYNGVGFGSGPGQVPTVVPIHLKDSRGNIDLLTLGNYDEQFAGGSIQNTAELLPVVTGPQ